MQVTILRRMHTRFMTLALFSLGACGGTSQGGKTRSPRPSRLAETRRQFSPGAIGCEPEDIFVSDESNYSWKVTCHGQAFYCGGVGVAACHAEVAPAAGATSGPPSGAHERNMSHVRREGSSGFLGCPATEVVVTEESDYSWQASCRGHTVYCGAAGQATVACHEAIAGTPASSTDAPGDGSNIAQVRREASSGFLGCPATEVVIGAQSNYAFTASCRYHTVYCGGGQGLTCSPPFHAATESSH